MPWPPLAVGFYERYCASCGGSGLVVDHDDGDDEAEIVACPRCDGEGVRTIRPQNPAGFWTGE